MDRNSRYFKELNVKFENLARGKYSLTETVSVALELKSFEFVSKTVHERVKILDYDFITNYVEIENIEKKSNHRRMNIFRFWSRHLLTLSKIKA